MRRHEIALLSLAVLVGLALRLYFFTGLMASDDLTQGYLAYHLVHPHAEKSFVGVSGLSVNGRRLGVNFPLGLSMLVFGVHEWSLALTPLVFSLAGILVIYGLLRVMAGPAAGMLAAWLWACLPADIYSATIWLQDNIFAAVFAALLLCLAASVRETGRPYLWAFGAGLALGYLEYVKETAYLMFAPLGLWAAYRIWKTRRFEWRCVHVLLGFLAVQVVAAVVFWAGGEGPLAFWKCTFAQYLSLYEDYTRSNTLTGSLAAIWSYLMHDWIFGYAVVLFPVLLAAALADRRMPLRGLLLLLLALQCYVVVEANRFGTRTQRYTLQYSVPYLVLSVLGLHALLSRLPARWNRRAVALASVGALLATAAALRPERQEHRLTRGEAVRQAYDYLNAVAGAGDTIYTDVTDEVPFYTRRALELLAGFQRFKGGFGDLADAYDAKSGWVVLTNLEDRSMPLRKHVQFHGIASHWFEVFRMRGAGRAYARVFRILPEAAPLAVSFAGEPQLPPAPPDISGLALRPLNLRSAGPRRASHWRGASRDIRVEPTEQGLRCTVTGNPDTKDRQYGGMRFRVPALYALRLDVELIEPGNVEAFFVDASAGEGRRLRWACALPPSQRKLAFREPLVFVPGRESGYFRASGAADPDTIHTIDLFIRIVPGKNAGFILRRAAVAASAAPPASGPAGYAFVPVRFEGELRRYRDPRTGASQTVELVRLRDDSLACDIQGDLHAKAAQYGGVRFRVPGLQALRLGFSLTSPSDLAGLWVDGLDAQRQVAARWQLENRKSLGDVATSAVLVPGAANGGFEPVGEVTSATIREVRIFARLKNGAAAGFVLHNVGVALPPSPEPPDAAGYSFEAVGLEGPPDEYQSPSAGQSRKVAITRDADGLRCEVTAGADAEGEHLGGVRLKVSSLAALRLTLGLVDPQYVQAVIVEGHDAAGKRVARWEWRPDGEDVPDVPVTYLLLPGRSDERFHAELTGDPADVRSVDVLIRVAPGKPAGFVLHAAQAAPPPPRLPA